MRVGRFSPVARLRAARCRRSACVSAISKPYALLAAMLAKRAAWLARQGAIAAVAKNATAAANAKAAREEVKRLEERRGNGRKFARP